MLADFKAFLFRGNVIDLAVAVIIGAAFTAVVSAIVEGMITPTRAPFAGTRPSSRAAAASAPVGSTTIFIRPHR